MPARPWADTLRLQFMQENLSAYESAKENKRTRTFLSNLHEAYFAKFPQPCEKLLALEKKVREPYYS